MIKLELTREELWLIIKGMSAAQYPINEQKEAFDLVAKLRKQLV